MNPIDVSGCCSCSSMPWMATTSPMVMAPASTRETHSERTTARPADEQSTWPTLRREMTCGEGGVVVT